MQCQNWRSEQKKKKKQAFLFFILFADGFHCTSCFILHTTQRLYFTLFYFKHLFYFNIGILLLQRIANSDARERNYNKFYVLVTAITPFPRGERGGGNPALIRQFWGINKGKVFLFFYFLYLICISKQNLKTRKYGIYLSYL